MAEQSAQAVNDEQVVTQTTTPADSAPAENKKPEVAEEAPLDNGERSADDLKPEKKPESPKEGEQPKEGEEASQSQGKAEKRKEQLQSEIEQGKKDLGINPQAEIRDLVSARKAIREAVQQKNSEVYQAATVEDMLAETNPLTGQPYTPAEAEIAVMKQKQELTDYNEQVAESQLTLSTEAMRALDEFGMFNESNKEEYDPELTKAVDAILGQSIVFDENTKQPIGSHISPYLLYKTVHDAVQAGIAKGQLKGQASVEGMLSSADNGGSGQGAEPSYESMSLEEKAAYLRKKGHDV